MDVPAVVWYANGVCIKRGLWNFTSGWWIFVPHTKKKKKGQLHSHISSSVLQRQAASAQVGHSGSICCYYFFTDNWLEQWNVCVPLRL